MFRAIADQLEGDEKLHRKYRKNAVDQLESNKDIYSPFIEDDETIDQYLADIEKDGSWGGQLEIQALSVVHNFNCIVHQVDHPIMVFSNYPLGTVPTIHISYHLGEHYNSVRLITDPCDGVPLPIGHELNLKEPVVTLDEEKKTETNIETPSRLDIVHYALKQTGCTSQELMQKTLDECFGAGEVLDYSNVDELLQVITKIYDDLELASTLETKLTISDDIETQKQPEKQQSSIVAEEEVKGVIVEEVSSSKETDD